MNVEELLRIRRENAAIEAEFIGEVIVQVPTDGIEVEFEDEDDEEEEEEVDEVEREFPITFKKIGDRFYVAERMRVG